MDKTYYVYEHWRLDKDECFYVGKGKKYRAFTDAYRNDHWHNIVNKLNRIGSGWEVRMVSTGLTNQEAIKLEIERIAFWKDRVDLSNKTIGGEGVKGHKVSDATRQKMSLSQKGKKISEEHKEKLRNRIVSKETREKQSAAKKGKRIFSTETLRKNSIDLWKNEEYREKQVLERKARFTEEYKKKLGEAQIGRAHV